MVSYGALSASVTAYIACLLSLAGLPQKEVALIAWPTLFSAAKSPSQFHC
jgi:hypothetical protein